MIKTVKEKAKAYDEAIDRANELIYVSDKNSLQCKTVEHIFPELKESKDERIRKWIISYLDNKALNSGILQEKENIKKAIAWLEKQGEQETLCDKCRKEHPSHSCQDITELGRCAVEHEHKPADEVKTRFEIGDLITNGILVGKIDEIHEWGYHAYFGDHYADVPDVENWHKWTIQDAKDGDVLATEPIEGYYSPFYSPFVAIYKKQNGEDFDSYCFIGFDGKFYKGENGHSIEKIHPATKEQRDILFAKMKEAGYEWDAEKKELKKIEQKPAWNEEDEGMVTRIVESLSAYADKLQYEGFCHNSEVLYEQINWLKSLRPQTTWRPSEEQMIALRQAISGCSYDIEPLVEIEEYLKKLKE